MVINIEQPPNGVLLTLKSTSKNREPPRSLPVNFKCGSYFLRPRLPNFSCFGDSMTLPLKAPKKTILVVEDTTLILTTVRIILEHANFTVLAAASADEAIQLAGHAKAIDLLLSDVMMPGISGPALALKLKESRPEMRVILMSGYPDGAMLVLNYGWYFIQKPFVSVQLVAKINEVLSGETRDQGTDHFDIRL